MAEQRGPIWLSGMMGAGKSSVGPALANALGIDFFDADREIERRAGIAIAAIFERDGEPAFRDLEAEVIESFCHGAGVVSLGGGALTRVSTRERVTQSGRLVYLRAQPETLLERIRDPSSRPLLAGLDHRARLAKLTALLKEREASYACASIVVDTDDASLQDVVDRIVAQLDA